MCKKYQPNYEDHIWLGRLKSVSIAIKAVCGGSTNPTTLEGASLKKMLNEIEALIVNGYTLKSITECRDEIFVFLLNESEIKRQQK